MGWPVAERLRRFALVEGNGDAHAGDAVFLREVVQCAAPAAADVQHLHSGLELQLASDQVELVLLGFVQRLGAPPIATAIDHALVQHGAEQVVAAVVVAFADLERAPASLKVHEPRLQREEYVAYGLDAPMEPGAISTADHLVELFAVPPTVHVSFADAQLALGENSGIKRFVVHLNVPRAVAVDTNITGCQELFQSFSIPLRTHVRIDAFWSPGY